MTRWTAELVGDLRRLLARALDLLAEEREQHARERERWAEEREDLLARVRTVEADYASAAAALAEVQAVAPAERAAAVEARVELWRRVRDLAASSVVRWGLALVLAAAAAAVARALGTEVPPVISFPPGASP